MHRTAIGTAIVLTVLLAAPAAAQDASDEAGEAPPAELVEAGEELFTGAGTCYACHGADATGSTLAPDLTDDEWLNIDGSREAIVKLISTGVPQPKEHPAPMPPMGGAQLTDEQIRALAAYIRDFQS